ncbi:MAG: hypothetical protein E6J91_47185 [Deltaproteobacteria bacterium]|nr:MAG: hypothetical protein E6J91_47185 [Deltaproteobacteria bacterium]
MATIDGIRRLVGKIAAIAGSGDLDDIGADERDQLQRALEQVWRAHAVYLAPRYGAMAAEPGYISCGGVLVPVHLAEDAPGPDELAELVEIGRAVRITASDTLCLSGSAALLSALEHVGDLDFCEYAEYRVPDGAIEITAAVDAHARRSIMPVCQRVKLAGSSPLEVSCHDHWDDSARSAVEQGIGSGSRYLKLDFVVRSATIGVVEATNVVLLLDDGRAATLAKSFAGQEVPVGEADAILPRPLCDPLSLGRYINFLRAQINIYSRKDPVKALKRGLSLARILFLDARGETILDLLRDPQGALQAAISAREALAAKLSGARCRDHTRRSVLEELRIALEHLTLRLRTAATARPRGPAWAAEVDTTLKSLALEVNDMIAGA